MRRSFGVLAAAATLALAGCAGTQTTQTAAAPTPPRTSAAASPTPSTVPKLIPTPPKPSVPTWGQPNSIPSGLSLTVTLEGPMPATRYVDDGVGHHYSGRTAVFKTTVHNGTTGPVDTSALVMGQPSAFFGPNGDPAVKAGGWDARTVLIPDMPTLQPGQSYSWEWGLDDASGIPDLTVQYQVNLPSYQGGPQNLQWEGNVP